MKKITLLLIFFTSLQIAFSQNSNWIKTVFKTTLQYHDSEGKLMESWNINSDENLVNNDLGFAIIKYKYDNNRNIIEQAHLDAERKPTVDNLGVSIWKFKYDKNNNKTYQGHFGTDGKLMITNNNIVYSEWFWKYTKDGKLKKTKTKNKL